MSDRSSSDADAEYASWTKNIEEARRGPRVPHLSIEVAMEQAGLGKYLHNKGLLTQTLMYRAVIEAEHNASEYPTDFQLMVAAKNAMNSIVIDSMQFGHRLDAHNAFGCAHFYHAGQEFHQAMVDACVHVAPEGSHPHMELRYIEREKSTKWVYYRYPGTEVDIEPKKFWEQYRKDSEAWNDVICSHMQRAMGSHVPRGCLGKDDTPSLCVDLQATAIKSTSKHRW